MEALVTSDILSHVSKLSQVSTIVSRAGAKGRIGTFAHESKRMTVNPTVSSIPELTETDNGQTWSKTPRSKAFLSPINILNQRRMENLQIQDEILSAIASKKFIGEANRKHELSEDK